MKDVRSQVSTLLRGQGVVAAAVQARGDRMRGPFDVVCDVVFEQTFARVWSQVYYQVNHQVEGELWKT